MIMDDKVERRERTARALREAEYAKAQRGNFFVRNHARAKRYWYELNQNDTSLYLFPPRSGVRRNAQRLIAWKWFERVTIMLIVANCFTLALYRPLEKHGRTNQNLEVAETIFTVMFTLEFLARVVANNFIFGPPESDVYLRDGWRVLDFTVVIGGWVSVGVMVAGGSGGGLTAIRGIRALRPLRSISGFPGLRVFVSTTFASMGMVRDVVFFLFVVMIVLGILGVQRYAGKLSNRCAYASTLDLVMEQIEFPCSKSTGGRSCGPMQVCIATALTGMDDGHSTFNNIMGAGFIIYRVLTLRGWTDLMYQVIDATGDRVLAIIYFIIIVAVGAIFVSSFMLAAVTTKYRQTAILDEKRALDAETEDKSKALSNPKSKRVLASRRAGRFSYGERLERMMERTLAFMRREFIYQRWLQMFVKHKYFENGITSAIVVNTIILAVHFRGMGSEMETAVNNLNYLLLSVFVFELVMKVLAFGILGYSKDRYNLFDATVVTAGLIELAYRNSSLAVARAFRLLRVMRTTRLITRNKNMRRLIDTTMESFSAILNFCGVLFVFVFVFTVLGMQLFGGRDEFWDARPNFNTFGDSFLSVFEILTGSHWYKLMLVAMSGSYGAPAALFFICWSFIGSFVLLNLIAAMLIDTFSRTMRAKELELERLREEKKETERREAEAKRQREINTLLEGNNDDEMDKVEVHQEGISTELTRLMKPNEIRRHPDAKRIVNRINTRKQRAFAREVQLIERWLEIIGFTENDSDVDSDSEDNAVDANEQLVKDRALLVDELAVDDGVPESQLTTLMREKASRKVSALVATGIPIPMDDRQVRAAYRRWRIDAAAEQGSDSDEDMNIQNTNTLRDEYGGTADGTAASAMEVRRHLQEHALAELRRSLLERSGESGTKDALQWASQAPTIGLAMKSAEARMRPEEQTAIIAQRRAEGNKSGHLGKFKGDGMSAEGAAAIAEANLLSMRIRESERLEAIKKKRGQSVDEDVPAASDDVDANDGLAPSPVNPPTERKTASWRARVKSTQPGEERKSLSESLRGMADRPRPGPVTESFNEDNISSASPSRDGDTMSNSHSARSPRNSRSRGSQTTGDSAHAYNTLVPIVEYTSMPPLLNIDYSLPRISEDVHAGKARKALGLPVRDIVVDETKIDKSSKKNIAEEDWLRNAGATKDEICMMYPSLGFIKPRRPMRRLLFMLIKHPAFEALMLVLIVFSCIQLALDAPTVHPESDLASVLKAADVSFTLIFLGEAIIKVIAMGFVMHPGAYLRSPANCFDFFIVIVSLAVETMSASALKFMRSFRLFRALRPLRLLHRVKSMQIVVATLLHVLPDLGSVMLLGLFQFLIFAILGSQLFAGKFDYCNDPTVSGMHACVGTFVDEKGAHVTRRWLNPPLNFDNTLLALLSLFVIVTRDGWLSVAFQGMDSTDTDLQPSLNNSGWTAIYFLSFIVILSFVWLSMIVALVCESYKKACVLSNSTQTLNAEQQEWAEVLRMKKHDAELKILDDDTTGAPRFFIRKSAYSLATNPRFEAFIVGCIIANTITMASYHDGQPKAYAEIQRAANVFFSWIFLLELSLKMVALFPKRYFSERWNVFDFIIVVASIPDLAGVDFAGTTVLRVIRLGRALRLFKQAKGLRTVFNTLLSSFESAFNVVFLIFMLMFVYAVLGMNLFGDYETTYPSGRVENFRNFGASLMVLLRVITRDNWKRIMFDTMKCEYNVDGVAANCSYIFVPALFFTSFILLGAYVLLSLIIASILDKFTENAVNEGLLSTANIFVTVRRKLLLDTFSTKLKMKLDSFKVKKPTRGARKKK